ncbi:hypothetical protein [Rhizobium leguminosarum]
MAKKSKTRQNASGRGQHPSQIPAVSRWTWSGIIGVVSVIAGIFSTLFAFYSIVDNRQMARESGSLRKSVIQLGFGNAGADAFNNTLIALVPEACRTTPVLIELPFTLANVGDKSSNALTLTVGYPYSKGVSVAGTEAINDSFALGGPPVLGKFDRKVTDSEPFRYIQYRWEALPPKASVTVNEPLSAPLPMVIDAHEIQPDLSGNFVVSYQYRLPVIIYSESELSTGSLTVATIQAQSLSEAMPEIKKYIAREFPRPERPWYDLLGWFIPKVRGELFVTEPGTLRCDSPNGSFVFAGEVTKLEFDR